MTKRLAITLVALALFVLIAVMPVSAISANLQTGLYNGSVILNGTPVPTIFIGEDQLNLTRVFYGGWGQGYSNIDPSTGALWTTDNRGSTTKIGWWAPGSPNQNTNPSLTVDLTGSYMNFATIGGDIDKFQTSTAGGAATWFCLTPASAAIGPAFIIADPTQAVTAWDIRANNGQGADMTGKSVTRGTALTFRINTNMASFTSGGRSNIRGWWNNGTTLSGAARGGQGNWYPTTPLTSPVGTTNIGYYWSNASVPVSGGALGFPAIGAANQWLTVTNWSLTPTTWGGVNLSRTMNYNNTDPSACAIGSGGLSSSCGTAGNLTVGTTLATGAGEVLVTPAATGGGCSFSTCLDTLSVGINTASDIGSNGARPMARAAGVANPDGFITIKMKDDQGNSPYQRVLNTGAVLNTPPAQALSLTNVWVTNTMQYFGDFVGNNGITAVNFWDTAALDPGLGTNLYPAGTYTVWTETTLSKMKDNYRLGTADYTGKTVSAAGTITIVSDTVKIEANKETVVRSKPFTVTVTGRPLTQYFIWVKGTSSMSGGYDNQPPMIQLYQERVYNDTPGGGGNGNPLNSYTLGGYVFQNAAAGRNIRMDVAPDNVVGASPYFGTRYYAQINTTSSGTRTIEFVTTNATKAQTYTIKVEQNFPINVGGWPTGPASNDFKSDEVDVKVEKGAVTITASGDQSYYLGEEIKFSGTNTETQQTFLFLTGPNLHTQGSRFYPAVPYALDPRRNPGDPAVPASSLVVTGSANTFVVRPVNADNTWDWKWGTANYALDAGTYTVYAVSGPAAADALGNVAYGTVSIIIKKPFISATASQSTVAQGDKLFITGTAEGKPQTGIAIWIMGKNYAQRVTQSVNSDASFSYEVTAATTTNMDAGQYFVVAQHPMQNQQFDIALCPDNGLVVCNLQQGVQTGVTPTSTTSKIFTLLGQGSLQGTDAAEALVQGINTPNVDDTYTKLVFLVEVPSIRIDPVGDRHVGDKFTITATTNLAVDDEVQMTVVSSSFKPTQKSQSGEFSGASGTVKVTKGDTGLNKLSFDVDASTFKPDEYIVTANRILRPQATATALFNVLEGSAPTAVPTKVVTAAPTAAAPTTVATPVPTATAAKTPTQPGFGALVALIGLGAVAFFVVRRH